MSRGLGRGFVVSSLAPLVPHNLTRSPLLPHRRPRHPHPLPFLLPLLLLLGPRLPSSLDSRRGRLLVPPSRCLLSWLARQVRGSLRGFLFLHSTRKKLGRLLVKSLLVVLSARLFRLPLVLTALVLLMRQLRPPGRCVA